jgi:hypothetical protein
MKSQESFKSATKGRAIAALLILFGSSFSVCLISCEQSESSDGIVSWNALEQQILDADIFGSDPSDLEKLAKLKTLRGTLKRSLLFEMARQERHPLVQLAAYAKGASLPPEIRMKLALAILLNTSRPASSTFEIILEDIDKWSSTSDQFAIVFSDLFNQIQPDPNRLAFISTIVDARTISRIYSMNLVEFALPSNESFLIERAWEAELHLDHGVGESIVKRGKMLKDCPGRPRLVYTLLLAKPDEIQELVDSLLLDEEIDGLGYSFLVRAFSEEVKVALGRSHELDPKKKDMIGELLSKKSAAAATKKGK